MRIKGIYEEFWKGLDPYEQAKIVAAFNLLVVLAVFITVLFIS